MMLGIYLILGIFAGIMSGLFGIGGGVVIVPALASIFSHHQVIPADAAMHLAIGTSLATMVVAASSSMYAHHKRGAVRWRMVLKMTPLLGLGAVVGAMIAHDIPSHYLKIFFGVFLLFIGFRIFFGNQEVKGPAMSSMIFFGMSFLIGLLSSVLGVGGGTLLVPFLLRCHLEMHEATGTSVACGVVVAFIATMSFMVTGLIAGVHLPWSTGYIYWPAFLGVAVAGLLFAPLGAMAAHKLPAVFLKRTFAIFLWVMAVDMLFA